MWQAFYIPMQREVALQEAREECESNATCVDQVAQERFDSWVFTQQLRAAIAGVAIATGSPLARTGVFNGKYVSVDPSFQATKGGPRPPVVNPTTEQLASAERLGVDPRWVKADGSVDWPPNYGFDGPPTIRELQPGQTFDRYGGRFDEKGNFTDRGSFVTPDDVPFDQRSLPDSSQTSPYRQYKVLQPIPQVNSGSAAPWFGKPGGGTQYQLPMSIDELVDQGFIRPIN